MKVLKNDLSDLLEKIKSYKKRINKMLDLVAKKGLEIARTYWGADADVRLEKDGYKRQIIASGEKVLFIEFGVGREGEGTYDGNLPTEPITFEVGGETKTTNGWEYYYDSKYKTTVDGVEGWYRYISGVLIFNTGEPANAYMWKTAESLREYIKYDLANDLEGAEK